MNNRARCLTSVFRNEFFHRVNFLLFFIYSKKPFATVDCSNRADYNLNDKLRLRLGGHQWAVLKQIL